MIGQDKLAEERKRLVIMRAANANRVLVSWTMPGKMGSGLMTDIGPGGIAEVERDLPARARLVKVGL